MSDGLLMGLDLGGGGVRCLLIETDGRALFSASADWRPKAAEGVPLGYAYAPDATWEAVARVAREALDKAGPGAARRVVGIAATSVRHASALLGASGETLLLSANRDARGTGVALGLAAQRGPEIHAATGHWPHPIQPASRLRWCADERPELLEAATAHVALGDWLGFRLCGEIATEASQACETGLLRLDAPAWAEECIEALALPRRLFPELRPAGSALGTLREDAASALGLAARIPVAVAAADTQCGLLGAGVVAPGQVGIVAGTTAPVLQLTGQPVLDPEARQWTVHHAVAGRWALESNAGAAGEALDWAAALLFAERGHAILHLLDAASRSRPGNAGFLSGFGTEVMDARRLELPIGSVSLNALTSADEPTARHHFARALLEGVVFGLRANLEQILATTGAPAESVHVTGGLSRSETFTQLLADALGRPVRVGAVAEASALGAAICAGVGAGAFPDLDAAARALAGTTREHEPAAAAAALYADLYPHWRELRDTPAPAASAAAGVAAAARAAATTTANAAAGFRPRILVTADLDELSLAALREIGDVEYQSFRSAMRLLSGAPLAEALAGVHVFITEIDVVDAAALLAAEDLRVVGVCRGDAVNIDLDACAALGLPVFHTPGRNADAVADLTLAFLLALARRLPAANAYLREPGGEAGDMGRMGRAFSQLQGRELWGKTVGLVGLGAVGRKVLARLAPFGARCLVHDPYQSEDAVQLAGAEPASLEELLARSDFVSLHAAVTEETRGLIGAAELARMPRGACLVNTARAALVDEAALVAVLESGALAGAALDVFAVEPPAWDCPLLRLDAVIATPHLGGNTREVAAHQGRTVVEELQRLAAGQPLAHALGDPTPAGFDWSRPRPKPTPALAEHLASARAPTVTDLERDREPTTTRAAPAVHAAGPEVDGVRRAMEALLDAFLARVRSDPGLETFAEGADDVTLHFTLDDLGTQFHLGFRRRDVIAASGPPDTPDDVVQLKLPADLLDGMLTGRRNAMQAAMDGELSFSGDTAKAMTLQRINADLSRLYRAAREDIGGPGDLAALPRPGSATPVAAPAGDDDIRLELCRVVDELYATQLITATGGNVSVRVPGADGEAWITPSQLFKGDLAPEILVRIGMDGKAIEEAARSPSSEALMHAAVLQAKPEATAVIHCHAPNATILVNAGLPFLPVSTEAAFFQNIGRIPFIMPGTRELADAIVAAMADGWAVLMQNHGLLVAGRTLRRAADMAEIIERTAEVILGCRAVGVDPPVLPEDVVETLSQYGDLMA